MATKGIKITFDAREITKALDKMIKQIETMIRIIRKAEIKRTHELTFKYKHIQKLVMTLRCEDDLLEHLKTKIVTSNVVNEMTMIDGDVIITPLEKEALRDWIKVLNGRSPLSSDDIDKQKAMVDSNKSFFMR